MPKKKSSTTKLHSLYDTLKIPQGSEVPCLGHIPFNIPCMVDQKYGKGEIDSILHDIVDTIQDGAATDSPEVQKLLIDLAVWLTCPKTYHNHDVEHNDHVYGKYQYVAFVLGERLKHWNGDADGETSKGTRSNTPSLPDFSLSHHHDQAGKRLAVPDFTLPRQREQAKSSDDEDAELEDGDEDEEGDEEEDEGVTEVSDEESTMSCRQRPKPKREGPMIGNSAVVTPIKQRGRPSRDSRASTPTMRPLVNGFDSLSVIDDAPIMSPESVISPGPSEVFSPISAASTPMSIGGPLDSEFHLRRSRYSRGEDESPTRRQRPSTGDGSLGDTMRKLKDSLKTFRQPEKSFRLDEEDSESERLTDEEEVEKQPTRKNKKASSPSLKVGNMRFAPAREDKKNAVQLVLKRLRQAPMGQGLLPGWVYCFAEKTAPGYLKIGSRISKGSNDDATLSRENQQNEAEVRKRLQQWERDCSHDIDYKFIVYMPCAVRTMERLVHLTLYKRNRKASCPNPICKTKTGHREWFEISEDEARGAVEVWEQFSKLMPYNDKGQLESFWFDYATDKYNSFSGWSPEEWLYECWANLTGPAAVKRRELISELQKKGTKLSERKKELELEIQILKRDEEDVRRVLAELQSHP